MATVDAAKMPASLVGLGRTNLLMSPPAATESSPGCLSDDFPGEQIHHDGEIEASLPSSDVGYIRHPGLI
jgi:hypothetical protein